MYTQIQSFHWSIHCHISTHPDSKLHVFPSIHLHPLIQQSNLLKVQSIHHEAANQGGAPGRVKLM